NLNGTNALLSGGLLDNESNFPGGVRSVPDVAGVRLVVDFGGFAKGNGYYQRNPHTQNGGVFSPGDCPGLGTTSDFDVNGGGAFKFEITNATGTEGQLSGWDTVNVIAEPTASLEFTASPTAQYTIDLTTQVDSSDINI